MIPAKNYIDQDQVGTNGDTDLQDTVEDPVNKIH